MSWLDPQRGLIAGFTAVRAVVAAVAIAAIAAIVVIPVIVGRRPSCMPDPANAAPAESSPLDAILRPPKRRPRRLFAALLIFLGVFGGLQGLYGQATGGPIERLFVETLGSQPAAALIGALTPNIRAQAKASRIDAPGGGINIRAGCEGSELVFLLVAAFLAADLPWRARLAGLVVGTALAIVLNQGRILALFYAFRSDRQLFDLLHTLVAPVVLIVLIGLYFHAWLRHFPPRG